MNDEKSGKDSPNGLPATVLIGPTGARSAFVALPLRDKFSALSYFCDVIVGQVNGEGHSFVKNEEVRQSAATCMLWLSALASAVRDSGALGSTDTDGRP